MAGIRVLHFSDAHVGTESYGRIDPASGLNTRLADFTAVLDEMVEHALNADIDLVLFTGDAYRGRDPSATHQREFARRIHRLSAAGLPVFLLVGNHDLPASSGRASSVDIFETLDIPNVQIGRKPQIHRIRTRRGEVQVVALPWISRSLLFVKEELRNKTAEEVKQKLGDYTAGFLDDVVGRLDPGVPTVLAAHLTVMGATYSAEQSAMIGQDLVVTKSMVGRHAFDYVALGHIHRHQVLGNLPLTVYAGSLERVDFGEESEVKGFVVVEVTRGAAEYRFVPVKARRFLTVEVDARGVEPMEAVLRAIERHDPRDAVVRVIIKTTPEKEAELAYPEIRKALKEAYYVAGIARRVEREHRVRVPELAAQLTPAQALEVYLKARQTPAGRVQVLVERAGQLIQEMGVTS